MPAVLPIAVCCSTLAVKYSEDERFQGCYEAVIGELVRDVTLKAALDAVLDRLITLKSCLTESESDRPMLSLSVKMFQNEKAAFRVGYHAVCLLLIAVQHRLCILVQPCLKGGTQCIRPFSVFALAVDLQFPHMPAPFASSHHPLQEMGEKLQGLSIGRAIQQARARTEKLVDEREQQYITDARRLAALLDMANAQKQGNLYLPPTGS